ncbi:MAG TPA: HAMP domain-containing sensor histidine kinase, partial [Vicinamibacterales bacterium]|nr:HAMP domain-containing sensor histidine kinase [Vicinamibacterales bacterium]
SRSERLAALGHMAATVAHQVGTPLNLVSGYVQMVRDDPGTPSLVRQRLEIVDVQIQQVTKALRTMLDQARQPPKREVTSVNQLIARVRELVLPRLTRSGIRADVSAPDGLTVDADPVQLELALLHLIANAIDAMPHGGTLSIRSRAASGRVVIEVADTGTGIPPSLLDRLFEPWVTTKPTGRGTGLGLRIVRDLVEAHGGVIAAANGPGGGAIFTIDLPAYSAAPAPTAAESVKI